MSKLFADLEGQVEKIYTDVIEFVYFMRGAISLSEALEMIAIEKNIAVKWLNKHLEKEFKRINANY